MLAAVAAPSGSDAVAVLVPVVPVPVPHEAELPALALPVLVQVPAEPLLLNLQSLPLPPVVVESEVPLRLQGRQSFSAAMAKNSPPTVRPTYERVPSTKSRPNGRRCPSA